MKRLFGAIIVLLAVFTIALPSVQAYQFQLNSALAGAEWTIIPVNGVWPYDINALYSNVAKNYGSPQPNFQTFCLEINEGAYFGISSVTFDNAAIKGGAGGGSPDPLSLGSAWLYLEFAEGILAGYNYTPGAGRVASSDDLQVAIWYLEDEISLATPLTNSYLGLVNTQFGSLANAKLDNNGTYGVEVLNPYHFNTDGTKVDDQSFLTLVPEPSTLIFLGTGLVGLAFAIRRRKNS